uniref:Uncharacterized protein n=1 Tax=Lepeophtheirus salmonis TaxID=72036 RepID=A0A0K2UNC7_LEPSM
MVREHSLETRPKAVGMIEGGSSQRDIPKWLQIPLRTIDNWCKKRKDGQTLANQKGRGRKKKISKVLKLVISKSLTKKRQSTRKLAARLTSKGYPLSKSSVHNYLRHSLNALP